jgi:hypothetical protein
MLVDLTMPWNSLAHLGFWILVPIMFAAVPDQKAACLGQPADKLGTFHDISSSANLRTPGMTPLLRSL